MIFRSIFILKKNPIANINEVHLMYGHRFVSFHNSSIISIYFCGYVSNLV